jgi:PAS domain S-box-containing protein
MALALVLLTVEGRQGQLAPEAVWLARWLVTVVAIVSGLLVAAVPWCRKSWQLMLHLAFDLVWIGVLCWITGGVASPAVPLFFAVILIGSLTLPGIAPFVLPSLAGLILGLTATLSLARITPLTEAYLAAYPGVGDLNRIVGQLAIDVAALFLVELLGQMLGRRIGEQRIFTSELLDQLGEGVVAVDQQGTIAYANDEAVRLLGLPQSELTGLPLKQVFTAESILGLRARLQGEPGPSAERIQLPDGRRLMTRIGRLQDRSGSLIGRTLLVADETRMRLLEENARRAEHLANLGEMAAGIAHEIRNPLASLRGCAQEIDIICRRSQDPDAQVLAGIMIGEADRLARIVEEFLQFARLRKADIQDVDLLLLAEDLERLVELRKDRPANLHLEILADPATPPIPADRDQIQQVLMNLVGNAIDAVRDMPSPVIRCRITQAGEENPLDLPAVRIEVEDNGPGIPPEVRQRLFTPFYSTKAKGTGLGLALASRIIREHEGSLTLGGDQAGGCRFIIHLPVRSVTREFRRIAASSGIIPVGGGDARSSPTGGG